MKKLKKLTRRQKDVLSENGFDYRKYLLERQDDKEKTYTYVDRETKEKLVLSSK